VTSLGAERTHKGEAVVGEWGWYGIYAPIDGEVE